MTETTTNDQGGKQSYIKARFDLLPPDSIRLLAQCMARGAEKYGDNNWHKITVPEHLNHARNHINEHFRGKDDREQHLVNALCRTAMALQIAVMNEGHETEYRNDT